MNGVYTCFCHLCITLPKDLLFGNAASDRKLFTNIWKIIRDDLKLPGTSHLTLQLKLADNLPSVGIPYCIHVFVDKLGLPLNDCTLGTYKLDCHIVLINTILYSFGDSAKNFQKVRCYPNNLIYCES